MSFRAKLTAAGLAAGVLGAVLAGTAPAASASPPGRAGHPGAGVVTLRAGRTLAAVPHATPPDSLCRGVPGRTNYGWVGAAPGSSADGGVANDLWWDATLSQSPTPMQIYSGNGGDNQQWCEQYVGNNKFAFFAYYAAYHGAQCLTVEGAYGTYLPGMRVYGEDCGSPKDAAPQDQDWYVCLRSGNSFSLEPAGAKLSSTWLDVWGGSSNNGKSAFVQGNPLQLWYGNGQDNQRFTFFSSPGEPGGLSFGYSVGVPGC